MRINSKRTVKFEENKRGGLASQMAEVVDHLPSKHEALSSNPHTDKIKGLK
jgi:hypothetical protein